MNALLDLVRESQGAWPLVAIFFAAMLEYLVPPFPADSIVLAGALLVIAGVHPFWVVAVVAISGGACGAAVHYGMGVWLSQRPWTQRFFGKGGVEKFLEAFRKWGMWVLVANRAFPGVRAVTFFAAGSAKLPFGKTMAAGLVSNVLWTCAILLLGVTVGESYEKIEAVFSVYKRVVYGVGALILVGLIVVWWRRRR